MASLTMNMYSRELGMDTTLNVLLPEQKHGAGAEADAPRKTYPVIYVLHGYSDNYSSWMRKSILEFVARDYDVVVIMPEVNNAFYADRPGAHYFSYVSQELPHRMASYFPISTEREETFVMGNSMGGYGAFLLALTFPERYAAAVSLSGVLGIAYRDSYLLCRDPGFRANMDASFGGPKAFEDSPYNLYRLAERFDASRAACPRLLHTCGTDDIIAYEPGNDFINHIHAHTSLPVQYEEIEHGDHSWQTWNPLIKRAFTFFGLEPRAALAPGSQR